MSIILRQTVLPALLVSFLAFLPAATRHSEEHDAVPAVGHLQDDPVFERVMTAARDAAMYDQPLGAVMQEIGLQFQGMPYMAGLLDESDRETLICRLDGFDCVTFVETVLALSLSVKQQDYTHDTFTEYMRRHRYRGGEMDDYCSRLHYFSEWILDNEERGIVRNITRDLGGIPLEKELRFMSAHRASYPRFATDDSVFVCIQEIEDALADLQFYYIPQDRIRDAYSGLRAGDVIATATSIQGLDVSHTGLAYEREDGGFGLMHASTSGGVTVSPDLQAYVQENSKQIGIVVARPTGL